VTEGQAAIRELAKALVDRTGNLPSMPGIFPDYPAPMVRNGPEGRELVMTRWGMPSSSWAIFEATKKRAAALEKKGQPVDFQALLKVEPNSGTTNIRNVASQHWRPWLDPRHAVSSP
jgi:putative SOS response-associated peptidase YedK